MVEASILFKLLNASILDIYKVFEHIDMLSIHILSNSLKQFYPLYKAQIVGSVSLVESKRCHSVMFEADSHLKLLPLSKLNMCKLFEPIDILPIGIW